MPIIHLLRRGLGDPPPPCTASLCLPICLYPGKSRGEDLPAPPPGRSPEVSSLACPTCLPSGHPPGGAKTSAMPPSRGLPDSVGRGGSTRKCEKTNRQAPLRIWGAQVHEVRPRCGGGGWRNLAGREFGTPRPVCCGLDCRGGKELVLGPQRMAQSQVGAALKLSLSLPPDDSNTHFWLRQRPVLAQGRLGETLVWWGEGAGASLAASPAAPTHPAWPPASPCLPCPAPQIVFPLHLIYFCLLLGLYSLDSLFFPSLSSFAEGVQKCMGI